jgi:hypothetical protein
MDGFLIIRVFSWKGRWHAVADRVLPATDRKHAVRRRVWSLSVESEDDISEYEAVAFAAEALTALAQQG